VAAGDEHSRQVVAAVPSGFEDGEPRLLVVRTSWGDMWTFPKGKVEPGESRRDAAIREAREEAGVHGVIEERPFTTYRYLSKHGDDGVRAYLLHSDPAEELLPAEPERQPEWVSAVEARRRLRQGREQVYADEQERVLDEALARLELGR
jgi:8-oxo-(d)GTP phosphatase